MNICVIIPTLFGHEFFVRSLIASIKKAKKPKQLHVTTITWVNNVPFEKQHEIRKKIPGIVIPSGINNGFTGSVNSSIAYALAAGAYYWYLVINDDTKVPVDFFTRLLPVLQKNTYDAVSCKIVRTLGDIESIGLNYFPTGIAFPYIKNNKEKHKQIFTGTCVFLSKRRVEKETQKHGYVFNPLFFAYAEDLELSLRIQKDGGRIYISEDTSVTHNGSKTAGRGSFFQLYHGYRNLILVIVLLWPLKTILIRLPYLIAGQLYIVGMSIYKGYWKLYPKIWWWIGKNWKSIMWQRGQYGTE